MTPEERFTRIENFMSIAGEYFAKQAETFAKHTESIARQDAEIDKHNAAIRDLIVVSRTILESLKKTAASIDKLEKAQKVTDDKLNILIDTVDRIIRNSGK